MSGPTKAVGNPHASGVARLTMLYVLALSAVALLCIAGQVLIQYSLQRQLSDSTVVNIAGRQRMLSQKVAKTALAIQLANDASRRTQLLDELREILPVWQQCHFGLQAGNSVLGLPNANSPAVRVLFKELQPAYDAIYQAAFTLLHNDKDALANQHVIETIMSHEQKFLAGMDAVVKQYEAEARDRVAWLRRVEAGLLAVTLTVLLLEGLFIFRPAVDRIISAIAALRSTSEELRSAKDIAESANRAKSQFLANMSHELRTPLHAILGMTELSQKTGLSPQQRDYLHTIDDSAQSLRGLLNDLLDMAQIEAGKLELELAPVSLFELAHRAVTMLAGVAKRKQISLRCEVAPDVPKLVMGDALRLRQVLVNLLNNAIKFTEEGTVRLRVTRTGEAATSLIRFTVEDTGIGIPLEQQSRIFERFTQVDSSTQREFGGVGLGLSICEQLVQLMGGRMELHSTVGRGSKFSFVIPLEATAEPIGSVSNDGDKIIGEPSNGKSLPPLQILVAEDSEANRLVIAELLQQQGHCVTLVTNGREAVEKRCAKAFDLIFMDLQMPQLDGLAAAREIREYEQTSGLSRVPLIALSATVPSHDGVHWRDAGIDAFLMKPARSSEFQSAIRKALARGPEGCGSDPSTFCAVDPDVHQIPAPDRWSEVVSRLGGRRELLVEIASVFNKQAESLFQSLKAALENHDADSLLLFAHRLKGQAANLNADRVRDIASGIEIAAEKRDYVAADHQLNELQQPLQDLIVTLQNLR